MANVWMIIWIVLSSTIILFLFIINNAQGTWILKYFYSQCPNLKPD